VFETCFCPERGGGRREIIFKNLIVNYDELINQILEDRR